MSVPASGSGLGPISRPESISTEVARRLVDYLLSGEVKPGQRVPSERALADQLGVGRSAIRDAVKPLQLLGLLDVRIGDGTYLSDSDSDLLPQVIEWGLMLKATRTKELIETRQFVEVALAGLAAARRSDADLAAMSAEVDKMRDATSGDEFVAADTAFHLAVAEAAHNQVLSGILTSIRSLLRAWIGRVVAENDNDALLAEHTRIHQAIEAQDVDGAEQAMRDHIRNVTELLMASVDADGAA